MGKLFNWIIGIAAVAATAYVLNTYSISRISNGVNFKGPKSNTTITYNAGRVEINNKYNNGKSNIETILGKDSNGLFGSLKNSNKDISGNFNPKTNKGSIDGGIGEFLGHVELDYDGTKTDFLSRWVSGFEYIKNDNGIIKGYGVFRI